MLRKTLIVLTLVTAFSSHAEENTKSKWNGDAELGYSKTSGNSDTESLYLKGKIINEREKWRHTGTLEALNQSSDNATTAKRWYLTGKSDYKIDDLSYLFVLLSYEDDEFSGFEYQINEVFGYGFAAIKKDDIKLNLEAGVGARQSKPFNGSSNSEVIARGAADLEWKISKTSVFTQLLSVEAGEDSTISRSVSALQLLIVGNLSAKLSHSIKHTSDVPAGIEKTDTVSLVTLAYKF